MSAVIGTSIHEAARLLREGQIVAIPTETVYGLAGNALLPDAVLRIFKAKNRPFFDPLIVHTHSVDQIRKYVTDIPAPLLPLIDRFMPGPLTVLLPRSPAIPDLVTSGLEHVAIRIPSTAITLELLRSLDFPLAAPSANPFGYISPTTASHVNDQLGALIPYILDGGSSTVGIESTIIGMYEGEIMVYRLGGLALEEIEDIAGPVRIATGDPHTPQSPGMLTTHYAPTKRLIVGNVKELRQLLKLDNAAVLSFNTDYSAKYQVILSPTGDMDEAAKGLFAAMRILDNSDADLILAEEFPDQGLGRAINDRLRRASVRA